MNIIPFSKSKNLFYVSKKTPTAKTVYFKPQFVKNYDTKYIRISFSVNKMLVFNILKAAIIM